MIQVCIRSPYTGSRIAFCSQHFCAPKRTVELSEKSPKLERVLSPPPPPPRLLLLLLLLLLVCRSLLLRVTPNKRRKKSTRGSRRRIFFRHNVGSGFKSRARVRLRSLRVFCFCFSRFVCRDYNMRLAIAACDPAPRMHENGQQGNTAKFFSQLFFLPCFGVIFCLVPLPPLSLYKVAHRARPFSLPVLPRDLLHYVTGR